MNIRDPPEITVPPGPRNLNGCLLHNLNHSIEGGNMVCACSRIHSPMIGGPRTQ